MSGVDMSDGEQQCVTAILSYHYKGQEKKWDLVLVVTDSSLLCVRSPLSSNLKTR